MRVCTLQRTHSIEMKMICFLFTDIWQREMKQLLCLCVHYFYFLLLRYAFLCSHFFPMFHMSYIESYFWCAHGLLLLYLHCLFLFYVILFVSFVPFPICNLKFNLMIQPLSSSMVSDSIDFHCILHVAFTLSLLKCYYEVNITSGNEVH